MRLAALWCVLTATTCLACGGPPEETCDASMSGAVNSSACEIEVPVQVTGNGDRYHWVLADGCVPVSYSPEMEPDLDHIEAALAAWSGVRCSRICFADPKRTPGPFVPLPQTGIHIRRTRSPELPDGVLSFAVVVVETATGRIQSVGSCSTCRSAGDRCATA